MKFGVREICDVVFKAKSDIKIGTSTFRKGQPVLYIDSAKTSTIEGAATTVYAQGGKGNTRLIAWEGEKTLTFTVEDALLSPIGFSILSGAGLFKSAETEVHVHATSTAYTSDGEIDLTDALGANEKICATAPIFVVVTEADGSITGEMLEVTVGDDGKKLTGDAIKAGKTVLVDYYVAKPSANVSELQIDAENFAGYYYVEASTLFRRQADGVDMPAELTLPNVKIQSNFTFTMASTGDPSTFTFTMDALPGYTYFNPTKKVLCVIQVVEDAEGAAAEIQSVMKHTDDEVIEEAKSDSTPVAKTVDLSTVKVMADDTTEITEGTTISLADMTDGDVTVTVTGTAEGLISATPSGDTVVDTAKACSVTITYEVKEGYEAIEPKTINFTVTD